MKRATLLSVLFLLALSGSVHAQRFRGCFLSSNSGGMPGGLLTTTGNYQVDRAIGAEGIALRQLTGLSPAICVLSDYGASNALAMPMMVNPALPDGVVAIGMRLMMEELQASGPTNFSIPAVIGHEFGHIAQFKYFKGNMPPGKFAELQADYLAGWYIGNHSRYSGLSQYAYRDSMRSFHAKGDYDYNSPGHHGTPRERTAAFSQGFDNSNTDYRTAFQSSFEYIRGIESGDEQEEEPEEDDRDRGVRSPRRRQEPTEQSEVDGEGERRSRSSAMREFSMALYRARRSMVLNDFKDLRGEALERSSLAKKYGWQSYEATAKLPGSRSCRVTERRGRGSRYSCAFVKSRNSLEAIIAEVTDFFDDLEYSREAERDGYVIHTWASDEPDKRDFITLQVDDDSNTFRFGMAQLNK